MIGGFLLLAAGLAMILLPGPGWVTIALGLALLATEFLWARHALDRLKQAGTKGVGASRGALDWVRRTLGLS